MKIYLEIKFETFFFLIFRGIFSILRGVLGISELYIYSLISRECFAPPGWETLGYKDMICCAYRRAQVCIV